MAVTTMLADEEFRLESAQQWRDDGMERAQPARVVCAGRECDVHRIPLGVWAAGLVRKAGAGKERAAGLVKGDRQNTGIVVEHSLNAITVVDVDVDVGDPLHALLEQPCDGDRWIVVDAKP